jgi:hypothetical protein
MLDCTLPQELDGGPILKWIDGCAGTPVRGFSTTFLATEANEVSVVSAQADVFAKNLTKIGKILRIFDERDEIKSRWVLCQS